MNNSKKLAKNNGVSKKQGGGTSALSFVSSKNKVLVNVFFYVVNPDVEKRLLRECLMD